MLAHDGSPEATAYAPTDRQYCWLVGGGLARETAARLSTMVVEPGWLGAVHQGQQDASDREMAKILAKARGSDAQYCTREVHGLELAYRRPKPHVYQLVVPSTSGLRQLLLQEMHNSAYHAHLGVRKTIEALQQRVWWP